MNRPEIPGHICVHVWLVCSFHLIPNIQAKCDLVVSLYVNAVGES